MSFDPTPVEPEPGAELPAGSLLDMPLRVWAEIGRARMPAAFVVGMPEGAIIDLDAEPHEPADLFVNGRHFGTGRLILVDGEWGLRVETLDADAAYEAEYEPEAENVEPASSGDKDSAEAAD